MEQEKCDLCGSSDITDWPWLGTNCNDCNPVELKNICVCDFPNIRTGNYCGICQLNLE